MHCLQASSGTPAGYPAFRSAGRVGGSQGEGGAEITRGRGTALGPTGPSAALSQA